MAGMFRIDRRQCRQRAAGSNELEGRIGATRHTRVFHLIHAEVMPPSSETKLILTVEGIRFDSPPEVHYQVYINLPKNEELSSALLVLPLAFPWSGPAAPIFLVPVNTPSIPVQQSIFTPQSCSSCAAVREGN